MVFDSERADLSRGPGIGGCPDARVIRAAIHGATCGRCRRRPATVLRGAPGAYVLRCTGCAGDDARIDRLRRAEAR